MRYLIVDDEPLTHDIIDGYCARLPFLQAAGRCHDAVEAMAVLGNQEIDLLFLDIRMPELSGFDLLRATAHPPKVIVVSAHPEHAIEGYDLDVCDYLLKPFSFERFLRAVNKARSSREEGSSQPPATVFIKDGKRHHQVRLDQVFYVEAQGPYSLVVTAQGKILTQEGIAELAQRLKPVLIRVHKSYLVAVDKIETLEAESLRVGDKDIPIGRVYKPNVQALLS